MTVTSFATGADQTVKLWSKRLEYDLSTDKELVGEMRSAGILIVQEDTAREAGDTIKFNLLSRISEKGLIGMQAATGNERALTYYQDQLLINQLRQAVGNPNKRTIDQQRVTFNLDEDTYIVLRNWMSERMTVSALNQLAGYNPTTFSYDGQTFTGDERLELWGMNAPTAPSSTRIVRANGLATDLLVNGDSTATFKLSLIDEAEKSAAKNRPYILPMDGMGDIKFRCYVHTDQFYQILQDTSAPIQWRDIYLNMIASGKASSFSRRFVYSQTEIIPTDKIPYGVTSNAVNLNTRRAVFCGRQAGCIAFGRGFSGGGDTVAGFTFEQDFWDIKNIVRTAVVAVYGIKKAVYNSIDHGSIVITTYVA